MYLAQFQSAMSQAKKVPPKGVKVSLELWKELKSAGLIDMKDVAAWGVFDLGFQMPFYQETILIYDPELETRNKHFELPPNAI